MGYPTESTEWPSIAPSPEVQALIDQLFILLDTTTKDAGDGLADAIFASDGVLVGPSMAAVEGTEAIRRSRDSAWSVVTRRRHTVMRVYSHDEHALDLLLIGQVEMGLANGKEVAGEFTARVVVAGDDLKEPRVKKYQVWADSAPLVKAMQDN